MGRKYNCRLLNLQQCCEPGLRELIVAGEHLGAPKINSENHADESTKLHSLSGLRLRLGLKHPLPWPPVSSGSQIELSSAAAAEYHGLERKRQEGHVNNCGTGGEPYRWRNP